MGTRRRLPNDSGVESDSDSEVEDGPDPGAYTNGHGAAAHAVCTEEELIARISTCVNVALREYEERNNIQSNTLHIGSVTPARDCIEVTFTELWPSCHVDSLRSCLAAAGVAMHHKQPVQTGSMRGKVRVTIRVDRPTPSILQRLRRMQTMSSRLALFAAFVAVLALTMTICACLCMIDWNHTPWTLASFAPLSRTLQRGLFFCRD